MKKNDLKLGGHPFDNDDLMHMQEGLIETTEAIVKALAATSGGAVQNCILWGMEWVIDPSSNIVPTDGAALLDGEVCLFTSTNLGPIPIGAGFMIHKVDSYRPDNPVTYADSSTHNPNIITKAEIFITSTPPSNPDELIYFNTTPRLTDLLAANMGGASVGWTQLTMPSVSFLDAAGSSIYYRKNVFNNDIEVRGTLSVINTISQPYPPFNQQIATLPAGYRPSYDHKGLAIIHVHNVPYPVDSGSSRILSIPLQIQANGGIGFNVPYVPAGTPFECGFHFKYSLG